MAGTGQLKEMRLRDLKKIAREIGIGNEAVEQCDDQEDPSEALRQMILAKKAQRVDPDKLKGMALKHLKNKALGMGVTQDTVDDLDSKDDPKQAAIELIVANAQQVDPDKLWAMSLKDLKKKALGMGVARDIVEDLDSKDDPKQAAIELILANAQQVDLDKLWAMSLKDLKKKALGMGVARDIVDDLDSKDDPKHAAIALTLANAQQVDPDKLWAMSLKEHPVCAAEEAGLGDVAALRSELQPLKLGALTERARALGATNGELAVALDSDDPKAALTSMVVAKTKERAQKAAVGTANITATTSQAGAERQHAEAKAQVDQATEAAATEAQEQKLAFAMQADGHGEVVLRETPHEGQILAMVPHGDLVSILQQENESLKVQWKTFHGWVKTGNMQELPVEVEAGFWEYQEDDGTWLPYTREECMKLDAVRSKGSELSMVIGPSKIPCVFNFEKNLGDGAIKQGVQSSLTTNRRREIRREASVSELVQQARRLIEECMRDPPDVGVLKYTESQSIREILGRATQPVKLLRGSWVTKYAGTDGQLMGLPRRQDLEHAVASEAFLPATELQEFKTLFWGCINILSISYCWRAADHPDADGRQLQAIQSQLMVIMSKFGRRPEDGFNDAGIFWDFCSLHQKDKNGHRTERECRQFKEALQDMGIWYLHAMIMTLIANDKLIVEPGIDYESRGWTHFERSCAELIKPAFAAGDDDLFQMIHELAEPNYRRRRLPCAPELFAERLAQMRFTTRGDKEAVVGLYTKACMHSMRGIQTLSFSNIKIGPGDSKHFASMIRHCCSLVGLQLDNMGIDEVGALDIAVALPNCHCLEQLGLYRNNFGDGGAQAIAEALPKMPKLNILSMGECNLTKSGKQFVQQAWAKAGKTQTGLHL